MYYLYIREDDDSYVQVIIPQLILTTWTLLLAVQERPLNLITHSLMIYVITPVIFLGMGSTQQSGTKPNSVAKICLPIWFCTRLLSQRECNSNLTKIERPFVLHHEVRFQLPVASQCQEMRENGFLYFLNTLMPRQNGRHLADNIFRCIFLNENIWISIKVSLKFVPKGPIDNFPAVVQIMVWRRSSEKPLSELMLVSLLTHLCTARPQWGFQCIKC